MHSLGCTLSLLLQLQLAETPLNSNEVVCLEKERGKERQAEWRGNTQRYKLLTCAIIAKVKSSSS